MEREELLALLVHLYEEKRRKLMYFVTRKVDENDAEDVVDDAFMHVFARLDHIQAESEGQLGAYLRTTVKNQVANYYRNQNKYKRGDECLKVMEESQESVEEQVLEAILIERLLENQRQLSSRNQDIIRLYYFAGLSEREIADRLQLSLSAVGVRLLRAKQQLRKCIVQQLSMQQKQ